MHRAGRAFGLIALLLVAAVRPAWGCKCRGPTEQELATLVVFAGTAVEYLERRPTGEHWMKGFNAATRFQVEPSRDLPVGASVVVMGTYNSDCSAWFRVGQRELVVAQRVGETLATSKCLGLLDEHLRNKVHQSLGIGADYFRIDITPRAPQAETCTQPATLDEAFAAADVVGWSSARAACLVPGTDEIEQAAVMRWVWKDAPLDVLRLRIKGRPEIAYEDFPFFSELMSTTHQSWPPAEFLRREGDVYVNDGCLNPRAPKSLKAGREAVGRLFPDDPQRQPGSHDTDGPLPRLSCSTLDQAVFEDADAAVEARQRAQVERERQSHGYAATPAPATVPPAPKLTPARSGSCAGCSVVPCTELRHHVALALLLVIAAARRANRRRSTGSGRSNGDSRESAGRWELCPDLAQVVPPRARDQRKK